MLDDDTPIAYALFHVQTFAVGGSYSDRSLSSLRVKDMILRINDSDVGGMTEEGFQMAMEVAGSTLTLVVSRYRFASQAHDRIAEAERNVIRAIDDAINDDQHLDWIDIGAAGISNSLSEPPLQRDRHPRRGRRVTFDVDQLQATDKENEQEPGQYALEPNETAKYRETGPNEQEPPRGEVDNEPSGKESSFERVPATVTVLSIQEQAVVTDRGSTSAAADPTMNDAPVIKDTLSLPRHSNAGSNKDEDEEQEEVEQEETDSANEKGEYESMKDTAGTKEDEQEDEDEDNESQQEELDSDGNPALGCVCGEIHNLRHVVFWIQCDGCQAWYNAAKKCLGFSEEEAIARGKWTCWACSLHDEDSEEDTQSSKPDRKEESPVPGHESDEDCGYMSSSPEVLRTKKRRRRIRQPIVHKKPSPNEVLKIGSIVEVEKEGSSQWGGVGRIIDTYLCEDDGERLYSVNYVINGYTEHNLSAEAMTLQEDF